MATVALVLSPAAAIQGVINYLTSEGRKIHGSAIHKLLEDQFDCVPEDLTQFLDDLEDRASQFRWSMMTVSWRSQYTQPTQLRILIT